MLTLMIICAFAGILVGLLAGLLGLGGGIVLMPILLMLFPYQGIAPEQIMHLALGTSLASIVFTSMSSSWAHARHGSLEWGFVKMVIPGIVVGTYLGSLIAADIPPIFLKTVFLAFQCLVALQMLFGKKPKGARELPGRLMVAAFGALVGGAASFLGIGGGSIIVPYMVWHNIPMHKAIGTSAFIGFFIAVSGSLGYLTSGLSVENLPPYSLGYIYLPIICSLVPVSMLVAPLGTRLAYRLPVDTLRKIFACMLIVLAIRMAYDMFF